jgi:hypothetical protein
MSTTNPSIDTATEQDTPADDRSKSERLAEYLRQEAADGEAYIKAKFIADDVGLSPKQIGALIVQLQDSVADLEIEKWSYTGATTWRVSRQTA